MRILIVSDTHGKNGNLEKVLKLTIPDLLIHLGDLEGSEGYIETIAPCPVEMVSGNNDFFTALDREKIITLGKYKTLITHGHYYAVGRDHVRLAEAAKEMGCQIVMYGHTHRPEVTYYDDMIVVNPGSISHPRQDNRRPSYVMGVIDRRGNINFAIEYL